jgi:hypothetical protein
MEVAKIKEAEKNEVSLASPSSCSKEKSSRLIYSFYL